MKEFGKWFFVFGAGSFVLNLIGIEFKLLMWIDVWGPAYGTAIRFLLMGVGAAIFLLASRFEAAEDGDSFDDLQVRA